MAKENRKPGSGISGPGEIRGKKPKSETAYTKNLRSVGLRIWKTGASSP